MLYRVQRSKNGLDASSHTGSISDQAYSVHTQNHLFVLTDCVFDSVASPARMKAGSVLKTNLWRTTPRNLLRLCEPRLLVPASWADGMRTQYPGSAARFL